MATVVVLKFSATVHTAKVGRCTVHTHIYIYMKWAMYVSQLTTCTYVLYVQ